MSAPGQFEKARQLATQAIDRAAGGLIGGRHVCGYGARVVSQPSARRALARAAVDARTPGAELDELSRGAERGRESAPRTAVARSSSSPICRRADGTPAIARRCRRRSPSRLPTSARRQKISRSRPPRIVDDRIVASVRNTGPQARQAHVGAERERRRRQLVGDGESRGDDDSGRRRRNRPT